MRRSYHIRIHGRVIDKLVAPLLVAYMKRAIIPM
jgi:hypothetical protein